jgi:hypothetical protein
MSPIVEQLLEMRPHVGMYVGSNSLRKLAFFLRGYEHAVGKFGGTSKDRFLMEFGDWVRERFSVSISRSWEDVIMFHSMNDDEAMERFWELFDEYLAKKEDSPDK